MGRAVEDYYTAKTRELLLRYGPGPRIHYHVGLFDPADVNTATVSKAMLRKRIVAAQEALMHRAAEVWGATAQPPRSVMDIGCGLGGGTIFWAQEHGCRVTAITNVADHVPVIHELSARAGVADLVEVINADFHSLASDHLVDATVAVESSCYLDRETLFEKVAQYVRPGGWFGIEDSFVVTESWKKAFDDHWKTRVGTLREYEEAAAKVGFTLDRNVDITGEVEEFWMQSMAWNLIEIREAARDGAVPAHAYESLRWHGDCLRAWRDRVYETRLLRFRR